MAYFSSTSRSWFGCTTSPRRNPNAVSSGMTASVAEKHSATLVFSDVGAEHSLETPSGATADWIASWPKFT